MATSFAAYASQFLTRQQNASSSMASSQPMFFSFTTDDGSRAGHNPDSDLDDFNDPHLRYSESSTTTARRPGGAEDDDDPYLRLDEDERTGRSEFNSRHYNFQSIPLAASENGSSSQEDSPKGWLAHLASPMMRHSRSRSRSSSPAPSDSIDSGPPPGIYGPETIHVLPAQPPLQTPPPTTSRGLVSLSLTESLLPRDGRSRPLDVFSLPDPRHVPRNRRKYNDSIWTAVWCAGVSLCFLFSIVLLFVTRKPDRSSRTRPYTTLLHTVPMLTILTFLSAIVAYTHILLLRIFARPVMFATSVFIPATLLVSAIWAFVGSFMWDGDQEPTWGETVGLRLFSILPLVLCLITARRLLHLPRDLHVTSSTLNLTTKLLINNPFLLTLSPAILLIALLASIPFLTLIFRLIFIGYVWRLDGSSTWEWHLHGWANWSISGAVAVWLWTWGVARGVLRMTTASVIGAWYFAAPDAPPPPPMSTHTIHAALTRSTGPSLGTIALSALILTCIRILTLFMIFLNRLPLYIPARAFFLVAGIRMVVGYLEGVTTALSKYALVYAGLTGDPFMTSARRAQALTNGVEAKSKRNARKGYGTEPSLLLLTIAPLTLTFPFALTTYLFVAHTLNAPDSALSAALLAGGVTAIVGLFCVGLVQDAADTLWICYCIDKDMGQVRREEVLSTFEYNNPQTRTQPSRRQPVPSTAAQAQPIKGHVHPKPPPPPQPQYMPSATASHYLPRQPLLPPSPSLYTNNQEDVPDPFEQSNLQDNTMLQTALHPVPPASAPLAASPPQPQKMKTSTELNMKSPTRSRSPLDESDEEEVGGSQFFSGSGIF